jgi:hypothetical protein
LNRSKLFIHDTPHKTQLFPNTGFPVWRFDTLLLITLQSFSDLKTRIKFCSALQGVQKYRSGVLNYNVSVRVHIKKLGIIAQVSLLLSLSLRTHFFTVIVEE